LTLLALAAHAGGGWSSCKDSNASSDPSAQSAAATSTETTKPPPEDVRLPGVDTSVLTPRERREFSTYVTELFAPCANVPVSIAQCVQEKRACGACLQAAKYILKAVHGGRARESIERGLSARFDESSVKPIAIDGSPQKGSDDAKVTVIEFADFECPYCREEVAALDKILEDHPGKVRLVYKVKLLGHPHGEMAARAVLAAGNQGKFWEMHHLVFEHQDALELQDLERYARRAMVDIAKWKAEIDSQPIKDRIAKDKAAADDLKIDHTPTVFANGREIDPVEDLGEYVSLELGETPKTAPSASASASASGAATPPASSTSASAGSKK
jgi:hypothetical protein